MRAVNQYRRRDVLTYLGLRYYLNNSAARTDQWARDVATNLLLTRSNLPYFHAHHFKEIASDGSIKHRDISLPGANEALAEAALLDECSNHNDFKSLPCVYSYRLICGKDRSGVFEHYFNGWHEREETIENVCLDYPNGVVRYTDIKRFYPSIGTDLALKTWQKRCDLGGISHLYRELGEKIITDHGNYGDSGNRSILTGPMFSHLLGNLVLRELDEDFSKDLPVRYLRYVDDIVLVGDVEKVTQSLNIVKDRLNELGFTLHDESSGKNYEVPATDWLKGHNDFHGSFHQTALWKILIGDLKKFLLLHPEERVNLHKAFLSEEFRIPVRDYTNAVHERSNLERLRSLPPQNWFRRKSQEITIETLMKHARVLRNIYDQKFRSLIDGAKALSGLDRKRHISKLRYYAGRLIYLATDDTLAFLSPAACELPELHFHAKVMEAVASGNIDKLLPLGTNAAQAAAQPLKAADKRVTTNLRDHNEAMEQALAIFHLNGVPIDAEASVRDKSELTRFARSGADPILMKSNDPFIRELACLHGLAEEPLHPEFLDKVFDEDEELAWDAIDQLQLSLSP